MKNKKNFVVISNLDSHINELGVLNYCNSLMLNKYKRFYIINHPNTKAVRAWQAHPLEGKCFIPIKGKFVISWVEIDDFKHPSNTLKAESLILDSGEKKIIEIPKGFANGLKALVPDSEILVFSEFSLEDLSEENIRYDSSLWFNWQQYD
jgi:dTDP-4-dehydrorhamnose 3,5-epimerase-like enzyme